MIKNVISYLEDSKKKYPDKIAYIDENGGKTFKQINETAILIASMILTMVKRKQPVLIYMEKSIAYIEAMLGVMYVGAFYIPLDIEMPEKRIKMIIDITEVDSVIVSKRGKVPLELQKLKRIFYYEDMIKEKNKKTKEIKERQKLVIDTDPIYAIFTSGSTGRPKGVLVSQKSVINFIDWYCETFQFSQEEIFANQTPFCFDASVKDIYSTLKCGATMCIVPKKIFSFPVELIKFLNDYRVTCIAWVPSLLCILIKSGILKKVKPMFLKRILFLGEVMPTRLFNEMRELLPNIRYTNLYGPTEATGDCTYYNVSRKILDNESVPIGFPCNNTDILLLNEDNELVGEGEIGEICVRGCSLALGYYNDIDKTISSFIQNPIQKSYPERIYKTGDLAKYNEYGELVYISRKDMQIKRMGYRVELGEIECVANSIQGVYCSCCFYVQKTMKLVLIYEGTQKELDVLKQLYTMLPRYMIPNNICRVEKIPTNQSGKIDRKQLQKEFCD